MGDTRDHCPESSEHNLFHDKPYLHHHGYSKILVPVTRETPLYRNLLRDGNDAKCHHHNIRLHGSLITGLVHRQV